MSEPKHIHTGPDSSRNAQFNNHSKKNTPSEKIIRKVTN